MSDNKHFVFHSRFAVDFSQYSEDDLLSWNRTMMLPIINNTVKCERWVYDTSEYDSSAVKKVKILV